MKITIGFGSIEQFEHFIQCQKSIIDEKMKIIEEIPINKLDLSMRTINGFQNAGFTKMKDAMYLTEKQLYSISGFGHYSMIKFKQYIQELKKELM